MTDEPLGRIRTLHEAAEYMRVAPRPLAKIAKRIGACSLQGRDILLSDEDIKAVWNEMRAEPKAPPRTVYVKQIIDAELSARAREFVNRRKTLRQARKGIDTKA